MNVKQELMKSRTLVLVTLVVVVLSAGTSAATGPYDQLITDVQGYAAETHEGSDHVRRWNEVLTALGALDDGHDTMTAAEAQTYADQGWGRWVPVVTALQELESIEQDESTLEGQVRSYVAETHEGATHVERWKRVLVAFGVESYSGLSAMTAAEAQTYAEKGWSRWVPVVQALQAIEAEAQALNTVPDPPVSQTVEVQPLSTPLQQSTALLPWQNLAPDQSKWDTAAPGSFRYAFNEAHPDGGRQNVWHCGDGLPTVSCGAGVSPLAVAGYRLGISAFDGQNAVYRTPAATYQGPVYGAVAQAFRRTHSSPGVTLSLNGNASEMDANLTLYNRSTRTRETMQSWDNIDLSSPTFTAADGSHTIAGQFYDEGTAVYGTVATEYVPSGIFAATDQREGEQSPCGVNSPAGPCTWSDAVQTNDPVETMPNWLRSPDAPHDDYTVKGWGPWDDLPSRVKVFVGTFNGDLDTENASPSKILTTLVSNSSLLDTTVPSTLGNATYEGPVTGILHPNVAESSIKPYGLSAPRIRFELSLDARQMDAGISYAYRNVGDDVLANPTRRSTLDMWKNIDISESATFYNDGLHGQFYDSGASIHGTVQRPKIIGVYSANKQ